MTKGENHPGAKLTEIQVKEIRLKKKTCSYRKLQMIYGCSLGNLHKIIHRKSWTHI